MTHVLARLYRKTETVQKTTMIYQGIRKLKTSVTCPGLIGCSGLEHVD